MIGRRRPAPEPEPYDAGLDDAHAALDKALNSWPEVRKVTRQLRRERANNHLSERIHNALIGLDPGAP